MGIERVPEFLHFANGGSIDVIAGPMFSGKSDRLIYLLRQAMYAKLEVMAFKPDVDNRRGECTINTFDGIQFPATAVSCSIHMLNFIKPNVQVVGIDEAQFFDAELPLACTLMAAGGLHVIVAGLPSYFFL